MGEIKIDDVFVIDPKEPEGEVGVTQSTSFGLDITHIFPFRTLPASPDITLIIWQTKDKPYAQYEAFYYSIDEGFVPVGTIRLHEDSKSKFDSILKDFENVNLSASTINDKIKSIGMDLYDEIFPEELKNRYWDRQDNSKRRISSIWITSIEPWIPWEILKPWHMRNKERRENNFLCHSFSFSRWLVSREPITKEQIKKIRVIVPRDTDLANARKEREWIKQFALDEHVDYSEASTYIEVKQNTLGNGNYDILHFSTHAKYNKDSPSLSSIMLEGGDKISPKDISVDDKIFGNSHPIVILNACQSGKQDFSFTGIQRWAKCFIEAGATAFICTLWSVSGETAFNFTKNLYSQLSKGISLGDAVKKARIDCRKDGDPSWLAYQLFGHPNMNVRFGNK